MAPLLDHDKTKYWIAISRMKQTRILMFIIIATCSIYVFFYCDMTLNGKEQRLFLHQWTKARIDLPQEVNRSELQQLQHCNLPQLDPFDPEILQFVHFPVPIRCKYRVAWLTYIDSNDIIRFNESAWKLAGYSLSSLSCTVQGIRRKSDWQIDFGPRFPIDGHTKMVEEFVFVECCSFLGIAVYTNVHFTVQRRRNLTTRSNRKLFSPNVLLFGIDSVSRSNFVRQLPWTYKFLVSHLNFTVLKGYNKVGDNTYPNIVPLLTGLPSSSPTLAALQSFNQWPMIWKNFSEAGYVTLVAEDEPKLNCFNYGHRGFEFTPSHHYLRPFWMAVESTKLHMLSSHLCFGPEAKHELHLSYLLEFVSKYRDVPFFAFSFLTELSHTYLNQVGVADRSFLNFFQTLQSSGMLNDTVVIVFSDHGHRFDSIRFTEVGRLEDNFPFCAVYLPPFLSEAFPEFLSNLKRNAWHLTSPFDIRFTLSHLVRLIANKTDLAPVRPDLFTKIPLNRTCEEAGIPTEYCSCDSEKELDIVNSEIKSFAQHIVDKLNLLTKSFRSICASLTLNKIYKAVNISQPSERSNPSTKLRMTLETTPGNGIFEALLEMDPKARTIKVFEDVNRVNEYGTQSQCLTENILSKYYNLRKYCYCKT